MRNELMKWQWGLYPDGHQHRTNLALHIVTVPVFQAGTLMLLSGVFTGLYGVVCGLASMVFAVAAQGRGHRMEGTAPVPFQGPVDVVTRIFVEQWVTFPRYVLSGAFGRAWRASRS